MKTIAQFLFVYTCFISIQLNAQGTQQTSFLYQIGIKETIQSKVLGEQRDIWVQVPPNANAYDRSSC